jgi:hypothetical protein
MVSSRVSRTTPVDREEAMHRVVAHAAFILAGILMVLVPSPATALVRHVAPAGIHSATCGSQAGLAAR